MTYADQFCEVFGKMYDAADDMCVIEEWMIELLEDDRPVEYARKPEVSDGLHWMYRAALIRQN
jgi:hypothetical protein